MSPRPLLGPNELARVYYPNPRIEGGVMHTDEG